MTYAAAAAHGAKIEIGNGASPEVFTEINGVKSGPSWDGFKQQIIKTRHHKTQTPFQKVSYTDFGDWQFTIDYDSSDTQHALLRSCSAAATIKNFKITLTDGGAEIITFPATIDFGQGSDVEGWNEATIALHPTQAPTVA